MKTREQEIKERREEVTLKLNIASEVVKMYNMYIYDNSLMIDSYGQSIAVDITNNLKINETTLFYQFESYRDEEMIAMVTISINIPQIRIRLW